MLGCSDSFAVQTAKRHNPYPCSWCRRAQENGKPPDFLKVLLSGKYSYKNKCVAIMFWSCFQYASFHQSFISCTRFSQPHIAIEEIHILTTVWVDCHSGLTGLSSLYISSWAQLGGCSLFSSKFIILEFKNIICANDFCTFSPFKLSRHPRNNTIALCFFAGNKFSWSSAAGPCLMHSPPSHMSINAPVCSHFCAPTSLLDQEQERSETIEQGKLVETSQKA